MPLFPVITMQRFDFKNSIIAIKVYLVMILNLYLTSDLKVRRGGKVWFCGGCALKLHFYKLDSSDEGFWKSEKWNGGNKMLLATHNVFIQLWSR